MDSSNRSVYAAIGANLGIAVSKFVAAGFTGSASMMAEGVHSLVDTGDGLLLLWGDRVSRKPPDEHQPFGYGKEMYFWTLIVALMIFALGGGVTVVEGVQRLLNPSMPENLIWSYATLGIAALFEGYSWWVAYRQLRESDGKRGLWRAVRSSKDPRNFTVLFEDTAALAGIAVAFVGLTAGHLMDSPYPDGIASVVIGLILAAVATLLAREAKTLLVGESAPSESVQSIRALVESDEAVERAPDPLTMQLGPEEVLLNLAVEFRDGLSADEAMQAIRRVEGAIREKHPEVRRIFIEIKAREGARPEGAPAPAGAAGS
jgi:cation diffusion facilitator family transporter